MICPSCGAVGADDGALCASCGRVLDPSGRLPVGYSVAGRYELKRFLGEGGMGTVYEAFDRKLEDKIALKILKPDFAHSVEMERRFRHEIKLSRKLRHPNVCAIHEYGEAGPLRYIAMELIEGMDLKQRLRDSGALSPVDGFRVAIQIALGLDCIHKAGVVHRDLKASNVMLDLKGDVRLMDFGIAKQIGAEATLGATAVGSIIGTPEYMSPEQGRGETIDYRSDLYSLGIVTYEIFTGDVPFRGDTPIATIFKTIQDPVDLDGPRAQGIPAQLRPVLLKALAKTAAERYASAEEMYAALVVARDAALGPGATFAFPPTRIEYPTTHIDVDRTTPTPMSLAHHGGRRPRRRALRHRRRPPPRRGSAPLRRRLKCPGARRRSRRPARRLRDTGPRPSQPGTRACCRCCWREWAWDCSWSVSQPRSTSGCPRAGTDSTAHARRRGDLAADGVPDGRTLDHGHGHAAAHLRDAAAAGREPDSHCRPDDRAAADHSAHDRVAAHDGAAPDAAPSDAATHDHDDRPPRTGTAPALRTALGQRHGGRPGGRHDPDEAARARGGHSCRAPEAQRFRPADAPGGDRAGQDEPSRGRFLARRSAATVAARGRTPRLRVHACDQRRAQVLGV